MLPRLAFRNPRDSDTRDSRTACIQRMPMTSSHIHRLLIRCSRACPLHNQLVSRGRVRRGLTALTRWVPNKAEHIGFRNIFRGSVEH